MCFVFICALNMWYLLQLFNVSSTKSYKLIITHWWLYERCNKRIILPSIYTNIIQNSINYSTMQFVMLYFASHSRHCYLIFNQHIPSANDGIVFHQNIHNIEIFYVAIDVTIHVIDKNYEYDAILINGHTINWAAVAYSKMAP